jgi:hypothetical protein
MFNNGVYNPINPDQTGQRDQRKQEVGELIRKSLRKIMLSRNSEAIIEDIQDLTPEQIGQYLKKIVYDQDIGLEIKLGHLKSAKFKSEERFRALCDYMQVTGAPYMGDEEIYFLNFAQDEVTVMAVASEENSTKLQIELFDPDPENTPGFILELHEEATHKRGLDDIEFGIRFPA